VTLTLDRVMKTV